MPPPNEPGRADRARSVVPRLPGALHRQGLRFFRRALELALRDASLVLCSSLATLERCREAGFDEKRLRHVPLGVRVTRASADDVTRVREKYALPERTHPLDRHRRAAQEPRRVDPCVLARSTPTRASSSSARPGGTRTSSNTSPRSRPGCASGVRLLGWVPRADLEALYAGATVMCFPSLLEGFGFPVVEAMAQGTPVVTSRGTSTEELRQRRRGTARRSPPAGGDRNGAPAGARRRDARRRLSKAGLERAAEYTWERTAELVATAYAESLAP